MRIQTRTIDGRLKHALETVSYENLTLRDVIPMEQTDIDQRAARDKAFAEKLQEVDLALTLARNAASSTDEIRRQLNQRKQETRQEAEQARTRHVEALRAAKAAETELEMFNERDHVLDSGTIENLLRDTHVIAGLGPIREVRMLRNGVVQISPYELVVGHEGGKYLLGNLDFTVNLTDLQVEWVADGCNHPHVARDREICWGDADTPVREFRRSRQLAALVKTILDWMTFYNPGSPYNEIENFEMTDAPEGWQIP